MKTDNTPVTVTTYGKLQQVMCARLTGSWQVNHKAIGTCDRYGRQINEQFRTGASSWRPIIYKPKKIGYAALDEYNRAVRYATNVRKDNLRSGMIIREPLTVLGCDRVISEDGREWAVPQC